MPVVVNGVAPKNVRTKHAFIYAGCGKSKGYEVMVRLGIKPKKMGNTSMLAQEDCERIAEAVIDGQVEGV